MAKAKRKRAVPSCGDLEVDQWRERGRNNVNVTTRAGKEVASWWDDDVHQMVENGFFKTRGLFGRGGVDPTSVIDYLLSMGACKR